MEMEYFCKPGTDEQWHEHWVQERLGWYKRFGVRPRTCASARTTKEELSHYSKGTYDIEYLFPMGWSELEGIANRTDFDLNAAREGQRQDADLLRRGDERAHRALRHRAGGRRRAHASWSSSTTPTTRRRCKGEKRVVLHLHPAIAPIKVAVLPLSRNEKLAPLAREVTGLLRPHFMTQFDDAQSIGRRYRRQDEIGTPLCVTVDFDSLDDHAVTIRERDSMEQSRVPIEELVGVLREKLGAM